MRSACTRMLMKQMESLRVRLCINANALLPMLHRASSTENDVTWSVSARLMQSLACVKAKRINKKCMYSNTRETTGLIASASSHLTQNFGRRDIKLSLRKMMQFGQFRPD